MGWFTSKKDPQEQHLKNIVRSITQERPKETLRVERYKMKNVNDLKELTYMYQLHHKFEDVIVEHYDDHGNVDRLRYYPNGWTERA